MQGMLKGTSKAEVLYLNLESISLVGMQAKLNSGIFIGPFYYYYIALFYFITNLDPIASGIAAGFTGIITFFVIYFVTKSLFSEKVAFIAVFLYTISYAVISV